MKKMLNLIMMLTMNLSRFSTNTTDSPGLSDEMKTYYSDYLVDVAEPKLVHNQFGQKHPIPKNGGKVIEFRRYSKLAKSLTPLTEGVTPTGKALTVNKIEATVNQYGDYIELSDRLMMEAIDNNLVHATKLLGVQSGETLDTVTREILNAGTNVSYGNGKLARHLLVGGESSGNDYLTGALMRRIRRDVKKNVAEPIDGKNYIGIVHSDAIHDLQGDKDEWLDVVKYGNDVEQVFSGEVGRYQGIRIIETTEAKIFVAEDLSEAAREVTVASVASAVITIDETLTAADQAALAGREILVQGTQYTVVSATASTITCTENVTGADGDIVYPGESGAKGRDVYTMLVLGMDAYGCTEVTGEGLQNIVKQLGSGQDPLNQRATTGWKATHVAEILAQEYLLRLEFTTSFDDHEAN